MRTSCPSDREKLLKFETEGREFAKILRSLEQFVRTVKGQNIFWYQNAFLNCPWSFVRYNKSEQLEFKLEKTLGFRNMQETLEKNRIFNEGTQKISSVRGLHFVDLNVSIF